MNIWPWSSQRVYSFKILSRDHHQQFFYIFKTISKDIEKSIRILFEFKLGMMIEDNKYSLIECNLWCAKFFFAKLNSDYSWSGKKLKSAKDHNFVLNFQHLNAIFLFYTWRKSPEKLNNYPMKNDWIRIVVHFIYSNLISIIFSWKKK